MNWIVKVGKDLVQALTDPYRPELHYMRGPGPKWRAKHSEPVRIVAGGSISIRLGSWTSGGPLYDGHRVCGRGARFAWRMLPVVPVDPANLVARYPEALP